MSTDTNQEAKRTSFELALPKSTEASPATSLVLEADDSLYVPKKLRLNGLAEYEPATLAIYLATIEQFPDGHIFDIGANVGVFSLLAARVFANPVTMFEPTPKLLDYAKKASHDNGLSLQIESLALGNRNGVANFYLSDLTDSSNSLAAGFRPASESLEVAVEELDTYCGRRGIVPVLIKVDTESTEPDVLGGGEVTIQDHRPWIICEVLANRTEDRINELIDRWGYRRYQITGSVPIPSSSAVIGDATYRSLNWLLAPEEPSSDFWERVIVWQQALVSCSPWLSDKERATLDTTTIDSYASAGLRYRFRLQKANRKNRTDLDQVLKSTSYQMGSALVSAIKEPTEGLRPLARRLTRAYRNRSRG